MTPKQFCKVCLLFGSKTPGEVADLFKAESLPPLAEVNEAALDMMDDITPDSSTVAAHARLWEVAVWACEAEARRLYTKALAMDAMTSEVQA